MASAKGKGSKTYNPVTGLTPRQEEALEAIKKLIVKKDGVSPSLIEIAEALGVNLSSAQQILYRLEARRVLTRIPGRVRSIRVTGISGKRGVRKSRKAAA